MEGQVPSANTSRCNEPAVHALWDAQSTGMNRLEIRLERMDAKGESVPHLSIWQNRRD